MDVFGGSLLWQTLLILLIAGNALAFIVGILLLTRPARCLRWFEPTDNQPRSVRQLLRPFDLMHNIDHLILGYPKLIGAVIVAGAIFVLARGAVFVAGIGDIEGGRLLERMFSTGRPWPADVWQMFWHSLVLALALGAVFALIVGLLALGRFQALTRWSDVSNRWVSSRRAARPLAHPYYAPDWSLRARPRLWGGVISAAALYSASVLFWLVGR